MQEKQNKIELFLKKVAYLIYNNPEINNYQFIYSQIMMPENDKFAVSAVDNQMDVRNYYERLAREGKSKIKMAYYGPNGLDDYFLYLYNGTLMINNCIKLYVPFKKDNLSKCCELLFDFISENDITHQSKIAKVIRNDNVVVRVNNVDDAKKVVDYVSSNIFLNNNLAEVNPFLNTDRGIGLAMDGYKSYNIEISKIISSYLDFMKNNNTLDKVSYYSFINYFRDNYRNIDDVDLKKIYEVFGIHLATDDYGKTFYSYAEAKKKISFEDKSVALRNGIINTYNKYGYNQVMSAIQSFMMGDATMFTNTNNARIDLISAVSPYELLYIMHMEINDINNFVGQDDLIGVYLEQLGCVKSHNLG